MGDATPGSLDAVYPPPRAIHNIDYSLTISPADTSSIVHCRGGGVGCDLRKGGWREEVVSRWWLAVVSAHLGPGRVRHEWLKSMRMK